jgi:methyl-accepting chemotaxis protein
MKFDRNPRTSQQVNEIAPAAAESSAAIQEISTRTLAEDLSEKADVVRNAASTLAALAERLRQLVEQFTI